MSDLFAVPGSWTWARFDEVASIAANLVYPDEFPELPHVAPNHIESKTGRLLPFRTVAEDKVKSPKHLFRRGQIVYSKIRPYLAKAIVAEFDGLCSADMYPVDSYIDTRYLRWWMLTPSFTTAAVAYQGRSVLPKINAEALRKLPVPVAPLAEQRRIVATLEDELSRLDAGWTAIESARWRSESLRRSLLQGELRQVGGTEVPMGSLLRVPLANGRSVPTRRGGFPVLRLTAVRNGRIDLTQRKEGAWTADEAAPFLVHRGDFFVSRGNGSLSLVGRGGLVDSEPDPVAFPDTLIRLLCDEHILPDFLRLVWNSKTVRAQIEAGARTTAGIYKINQDIIERIRVPLPRILDQTRIVASVETSVSALLRGEAGTESARRRAESLRHSLLIEAFSGRLVPQDPSDEAAALWVARVRSQREARESKDQSRGNRLRKSRRPDTQQETLL